MVTISYFKTTFLLLMSLSAISCSLIKMVAIKNDTNEVITFQGDFESRSNAQYSMDFTLDPGKNNSWAYEIGSFEENILDKGLKKITLKNERGCTVVLERML